MRKALQKEELAQVLDYDPEFLDWYFSVQCERELNAVIKQRKYVRKYYYEHKKKNNTKTKTEHHQKKYYEKLKADPERYNDYLKKKREYSKIYLKKKLRKILRNMKNIKRETENIKKSITKR